MDTGWYSAQDLAGLPGMPGTERRVRERLQKNLPLTRNRSRGKGLEYPRSCLPDETQAALLERELALPAPEPVQTTAAPATPPSPSSSAVAATIPAAALAPAGPSLPVGALSTSTVSAALTDAQRRERDARIGVLHAIRRYQAEAGCSEDRAVRDLLLLAATGKLDAQTLATLKFARDGRGRKSAAPGADSGLPSARTLARWLASQEGGGGLAPKLPQMDLRVPAWAPALLQIWQCPQKISLAGALRPFVRRDTSHMWPGDAYTADGHTFDAEVAHPAHGRPFRPEITTIIDIATRRAVGISVGLAESTWAVLDALRRACEVGGVPAILYVDRGSGYTNALMADEAIGFFARLGITCAHSLPYNAQARGLMERAHQTIWVTAAKDLQTYMGADMDREAKHDVYKITRADIRTVGRSPLLMPWADFGVLCQRQIVAYNQRPHGALPKIRGEDGLLRHQSPDEAWQAAIGEGWKPVTLSAEEAKDLFRPAKICSVRNGEIVLHGHTYFARALEAYHGNKLRVGWDTHDATRVWVSDMDGRFLCLAEFEANKRRYFPQAFEDRAKEERAKAAIKRAQARIDDAMAEVDPPELIEHQASPIEAAVTASTAVADEVETPPDGASAGVERPGPEGPANVVALPRPPPKRPFWSTDAEKYRWLLRWPEAVSSEDQGWIAWYRSTSEYEDLFGDADGFELATR